MEGIELLLPRLEVFIPELVVLLTYDGQLCAYHAVYLFESFPSGIAKFCERFRQAQQLEN